MFQSMNKSRLIMAGGTLTCAMGIGVLMQMPMSDAAPEDMTPVQAASVVTTPTQSEKTATDEIPAVNAASATGYTPGATGAGADEIDLATLGDITLTRADPEPPMTAPEPATLPSRPLAAQSANANDMDMPDLPTEEGAPGFACDMDMTAVPAAAALVAVELSAPCMANARFTLHHNGMMITGVTDAAGQWQADIPALARQAMFIVAFSNDEGAVATAEVPDLADFDRYVVQWTGESGLQIHAREYGSQYGQDGHVWYKAAQSADTAANGEGGFLLRLGEADLEAAQMAEIYSFPTAGAQRDGEVQISLESEITRANCGRDIEAQALIKTADGAIGARDLKLAIPDCNAVGDFLVLKNLYQDLKIAAN